MNISQQFVEYANSAPGYLKPYYDIDGARDLAWDTETLSRALGFLVQRLKEDFSVETVTPILNQVDHYRELLVTDHGEVSLPHIVSAMRYAYNLGE